MNEATIFTYSGDDDTIDVEKFDAAKVREELAERGSFKFHATLKADDDSGKRIVKGYANTKQLDRVNEIVDPNAFRGTLKQWMKNPVILADHWPSVANVIGKAIEAKIDNTGLYLKAQIAEGTQLADDTWSLIQQGMIKAFSIGYRVLKDDYVSADGKEEGARVRKILKLELYEVSVVAIPANRQSLFSVAKGMIHGTDMFRYEGVDEDVKIPHTEDEFTETLAALKEVNTEMELGLIESELRNW